MSLGMDFPDIRLEAYNPEWAAAYAEERDRILSGIRDQILAIEHVGSTAIPGVCAKPIIDIAIAVRSLSEAEQFEPQMARIGYDFAGDGGVPGGRIYGRGPEIRTPLVPAVGAASQEWRDHINFLSFPRAEPPLLFQSYLLQRALPPKFSGERGK